jgi:hypothetical protein
MLLAYTMGETRRGDTGYAVPLKVKIYYQSQRPIGHSNISAANVGDSRRLGVIREGEATARSCTKGHRGLRLSNLAHTHLTIHPPSYVIRPRGEVGLDVI